MIARRILTTLPSDAAASAHSCKISWRESRIRLRALLLLGAFLLSMYAPPGRVGAAVTDVPCELNAFITAVTNAASGDTLTLPDDCTITLTQQTSPFFGLSIGKTLTIAGLGNGATIERSSASDTPQFTLVNVYGALTLKNLTLRNGRGSNAGGRFPAFPGGIRVSDGGNLTLLDSTITGNVAGDGGGIPHNGGDGGGLFITGNGNATLIRTSISANSAGRSAPGGSDGDGGGIYISGSGSLTLIDSTVSGNSIGASGIGGGVYVSGQASAVITNSSMIDNQPDGVGSSSGVNGIGSGVYLAGTSAVITNSRLIDNRSDGVGNSSGIYGGANIVLDSSTVSGSDVGIVSAGGWLSVNSSTVSGNGDAIVKEGGEFMLTNSTISGNSRRGIIAEYEATLRLTSSTISANSSDGILINSGSVTSTHTIIIGNGVSDCRLIIATLTSTGNNLVGQGTGCPTSSSDRTVDPAAAFTSVLTPLGAHGGPTQTHALLPGSPAIDAGNPEGCADAVMQPLATDQRGTARPQDGDGDGTAICDIGAYELVPPIYIPMFRFR